MSEDKAKSKPATELKSTNGQAVTFPVTLELDRLDGGAGVKVVQRSAGQRFAVCSVHDVATSR